MALQIRRESSEPTTVTLTLDGQLDAVTAPELEQFITANVNAAVTTLVLDLGKLSFISSAGLRTFAKSRKTMAAQNGRVCFLNLSPQVQKVFEIVKAVPHSEVFRNYDELDNYLTLMQRKVTEEQRAKAA
jgi:anti-sigma B factor antagonist